MLCLVDVVGHMKALKFNFLFAFFRFNTMAKVSVLSDDELLSLAEEFTLEKDFFKLGVKLNFLIPALHKTLKECKDDIYRATLMTLQQWRDQQLPGTDVRFQASYHLKTTWLSQDC